MGELTDPNIVPWTPEQRELLIVVEICPNRFVSMELRKDVVLSVNSFSSFALLSFAKSSSR